eukprot:COSAG02_NODE_14939_length_1221_cov_19180.924242_1_plen_45_part_10
MLQSISRSVSTALRCITAVLCYLGDGGGHAPLLLLLLSALLLLLL